MTRKSILQLLFCAIVIVFTTKFIWQEASPKPKDLLENVFLHSVQAKKFSASGSIDYLLTAHSIEQQASGYNIKAPRLTSQSWELSANTAFWEPHQLTLKQEVRLALANKHLATTSLLNIDLKANTASTPEKVEFQNNNTTIKALGMEIDLATASIKLNHNITGKTTYK